jgi:4-hydroxy-tetrahydrodipicolinate synthase
MLSAADLIGIFPALVTPFGVDGAFDRSSYAGLIRRMFDGGAAGVVALGGTGEYTALSPAERRSVIEAAVADSQGRGPVIAGVLSPGFAEAVEAARDFAAAGVDALLVVTPFYVLAGQQGLLDYHRRLRDAVDLPLVLYDIPSRTNVCFAPQTVAKLAEEGVAIGIKYSNYDLVSFTRVTIAAGESMTIMTGEDPILVAHAVLGARGAILATANLAVEPLVECLRRVVSGDVAGATALQKALYPLLDAVFSEPNPGPLKKAMEIIGHPVGSVRLPLVAPSAETEATLRRVLKEMPGLTAREQLA